MPSRRNGIARTTNSTSGYAGGSRTMSVSSGGKIGRKGQFTSRRKIYYDVRKGLGLSGG